MENLKETASGVSTYLRAMTSNIAMMSKESLQMIRTIAMMAELVPGQ
jgi:hypothetical protein